MSKSRLPRSLAAILFAGLLTFSLSVPTSQLSGQEAADTSKSSKSNGWIQLFNGKDLSGWTPKIRGHKLGDNYADTFRVKDGLLTVSYDKYVEKDFMSMDGKKPSWEKFGHLFYDTPYSHYMLRVEYRFVGDQVKNGPGWAFRNNGLMLHGQDPKTMTIDQPFPVSIEVQLLGGDGTNKRSTLNLCTPGTHVVKDGELFKPHCTSSNSETFHGDDWVTVEVEVRGNEIFRHWVGDKVVLEYTKPQLDPKDKRFDVQSLIAAQKGDVMISGGTISLQSESHGTQFRKIELFELDPNEKYDPKKKPTVPVSAPAEKVAGDWGHLTGKIVVKGDVPAPAKLNFGANKDAKACGPPPVDPSLIVSDKGELKNVLVMMYRKNDDPQPKVHPAYAESMAKPVVADNKNCMFAPQVVMVRLGQEVEFKNSDKVGHNCHVTSFANEVNMTVPAGKSVMYQPTEVDKAPGILVCDIHDWMKGTFVVKDNPYMTTTNDEGTFKIENIPAGTWKFQFWHVKGGYLKKLDIPGFKVGRRGEIEVTIEKDKPLELGEMTIDAGELDK